MEKGNLVQGASGKSGFATHDTAFVSSSLLTTHDDHESSDIGPGAETATAKKTTGFALATSTSVTTLNKLEDDPNGNIRNHGPVASLPLELLGSIMRCVIWRTGKHAPRITETDPTQMAHLRFVCRTWNDAALCTPELWRGLLINLDRWCSNGRLQGLSSFANTWYARAGTGNPPLRIAIRGSEKKEGEQDREEHNELLLTQILSILFGQHRSWTEWSFSSLRLLEALKPFEGLASAFRNFKSVEGANVDPYTQAVGRLKHVNAEFVYPSFWKGIPLTYGLLDPRDIESLSWDSAYLSNQEIRPNATIPKNSFPSHLRFLHLHGCFVISLTAIFEAPLLEELVVEALKNTCQFVNRDPTISHSLQRLVFIGDGAAIAVWANNIFEQLTLPSLKLIQHRNITRYLSWPHEPLAITIAQFFERSGLTDIELSLRDEDLNSKKTLDWILNVFGVAKISKLFLDSPIPLLHLPTTELQILQNAVQAIICRSGFKGFADPEHERALPTAGNKKTLLMLPSTSHSVPDVFAEEVDVQFLSHHQLDGLLDHGIQSHQYQLAYSDF